MTDVAKTRIFLEKTSALAVGEIKRCTVKNAAIHILLANVDGTFYAIDDICPHEDVPLSTGCLQGHLIKCSLHGSRFDLRTGHVQNDPAEDNLTTHTLCIEEDNIFLLI